MMFTRESPYPRVPALAAASLGAGTLLYFMAAFLEGLLGAEGLAAVLVEEGLKLALLALAAAAGSRLGRKTGGAARRIPPEVSGILWGLSAIAIFAGVENLAYFAAFPGKEVFLRLLWAEPVHLASGLAEGFALALLLKPFRLRAIPQALAFLAGACLWHFAFNLASVSLPWLSPAHLALGGGALNLIALSILGYRFSRSVAIGGFLYGQH